MLQGEDFIKSVTVKDENDNLIDLTEVAITQIKCFVFVGAKLIEKFALVTPDTNGTTYSPLVLDGTNKVVIKLTRQQTATMPTGTLFVETTVIRTDANFAEGKQTKYLSRNVEDVLQSNSY